MIKLSRNPNRLRLELSLPLPELAVGQEETLSSAKIQLLEKQEGSKEVMSASEI